MNYGNAHGADFYLPGFTFARSMISIPPLVDHATNKDQQGRRDELCFGSPKNRDISVPTLFGT